MALIGIGSSVGKGGSNNKRDVEVIQRRLNEIGKNCGKTDGICGAKTIAAIYSFQKHFMEKPDSLISPNRRTIHYLNIWSIKPVSPGVYLRGNLQKAWDLVNPLLPRGSYCSSGYRSPEKQRQILHRFYSITYKRALMRKYGSIHYNDVWANRQTKETEMLRMVKVIGQAIAAPGRSMHQKGKAFDIGGPSSIDMQQVRVAKMVASANPDIFSGKVIHERNGCVHVEIK